MKAILDLIARHKSGEPCGMFSVCSAHPLVIEATLLHARRTGAPFALIEATSNQVNQDGGYTGMKPADFRDFVHRIADRVGLPRDRIVLGGDHLGPNAWQAAARRSGDGTGRRADRGLCSRGLPQDPSRLLDGVRRRSGAAVRRDDRRARGAPLRGRRARPCCAPAASRRSMSSAPRSRFPAAPRKSSTRSRSRRPPRRARRSTCIARSSPRPASPTPGRA